MSSTNSAGSQFSRYQLRTPIESNNGSPNLMAAFQYNTNANKPEHSHTYAHHHQHMSQSQYPHMSGASNFPFILAATVQGNQPNQAQFQLDANHLLPHTANQMSGANATRQTSPAQAFEMQPWTSGGHQTATAHLINAATESDPHLYTVQLNQSGQNSAQSSNRAGQPFSTASGNGPYLIESRPPPTGPQSLLSAANQEERQLHHYVQS